MNMDFIFTTITAGVSIITAIVAIVALVQSSRQIKLSNKQHLFDRRKKVYTIFIGLFRLLEENISSLKKEVNSKIIYEDMLFKGLANNSYLSGDCNIINDTGNTEYKIRFLTKMEELHDIVIDDFSMSWNLGNSTTWAIDEESVNEAGCIHTSQGLEFDYVGIIIGDDLRYENGKVVTDFTKRAKIDQTIKGLKKLYNENYKFK